MDIKALDFSSEIERAILSMSLKVELSEKKRIRATKSIENLVLLLKVAKNSHAREVVDALVNFVNKLNTKQLSFFKSIGLNLMAQSSASDEGYMSYRGARLKKAAVKEEPHNSHHGKKRIVYRGSERWV